MAAPPVLLVADDLAIIAAVKRVLAREGYECVLATNAADAIIAWGHALPGLVLLQPSVEGERGGVVLEELQNHPDARLLRVLVLGDAVAGFDWPVEPLPIDGEHLTRSIEANVRGADESAQWSVHETAPHDAPRTPAVTLHDEDEEPDAWRATSPQAVDAAEAANEVVPEPEAIPSPTPPEPGVSAALEEKLFGDLAADVEASAMQSVESSLPQQPDDEELQRLEDEVRAEAQRRRLTREAQAVQVKPAPPTPPPPPPSATPPVDDAEASFGELSDTPAAPPSRAGEVLARAEQMVLDSRAQSEAQQRADEADERTRSEAQESAARRIEHTEELVRQEREARQLLEEEVLSLREAVEANGNRARDEAASMAVLESALTALRESTERLEAELAAERQLRATAEDAHLTAQDDAVRLQTELATARAQLNEAKAQLEVNELHLVETREARDAAQREMLAMEETRERLNSQLTEAQARVEGLTADVTSASELLEETARERDGLRGRVATLEPTKALAEQMSAELDAEKKRAEALEATVELATEKVKELEAREIMPVSLPGNRAVGLARHGTVSLDALARVVSQVVLANVEAKLELGVAGGVRTLWFKRGQVVAAESTIDHEGLLTRARRDGLIDSKQDAELRMLRGAPPREQLEALKARAFIRDIESVPLVQRYTEQVALDAFTEETTNYRLVDEAPPPTVLLATVPRPTLPMLAESLRRAITPDVLLEKLGGGEAVPSANESELDLRALGFSERERKMLSWVDGEASVEDLSLASGLKPDAAFRALLVAQHLGIIDVRPGSKKTESTSGQLDVDRLEAKYDEVQDADYFTILGLPRVAGTEDVKRAFQRLSQEFDPLRYSGHPDPALQQRAQTVARLLEEAARALEDDRRRAEYARHLLD